VFYEAGQEYQVSIALTDLRAAGTCAAPAKIIVNEGVPAGWTAKDPSSGGTVSSDGTYVRWDVDPTGGLPALSYKAVASEAGLVSFQGQLQEADAGYVFRVEGQSTAVGSGAIPRSATSGASSTGSSSGPSPGRWAGRHPATPRSSGTT